MSDLVDSVLNSFFPDRQKQQMNRQYNQLNDYGTVRGEANAAPMSQYFMGNQPALKNVGQRQFTGFGNQQPQQPQQVDPSKRLNDAVEGTPFFGDMQRGMQERTDPYYNK